MIFQVTSDNKLQQEDTGESSNKRQKIESTSSSGRRLERKVVPADNSWLRGRAERADRAVQISVPELRGAREESYEHAASPCS